MGLTILYFLLVSKYLSIRSYWYDEFQALTHSTMPFFKLRATTILGKYIRIPELIYCVYKFDPHPAFYYIQLHFWQLFSHSELWFRLNSVLFSIASIIIVYLNLRKQELNNALLAVIFLVCSPIFIYYSTEVRMYILMIFFALAIYFLLRDFIENPLKKLNIVLLTLSIIIFPKLHGAGFIIFSSIWIYAFLMLVLPEKTTLHQDKMWGKKLLKILILFIITVISIAMQGLWIYNNKTHTVNHAINPGFRDIFRDLAILILGFKLPNIVICYVVAGVVFAAIIVSIISSKRSFSMVFSFLFMPILSTLLISKYHTQIWLVRTISFILPFIFISCADGLLIIQNWFKNKIKSSVYSNLFFYSMFAVILIVLIIQSSTQLEIFSDKFGSYKNSILWCENNIPNDEVIFVLADKDLWCFGWYYLGPGSINPLKIKSQYKQGNSRVITGVNKNGADFDWIYARYNRKLPKSYIFEQKYSSTEINVYRVKKN